MGADHTIAKSWKRRYAQSSRTARERSDGSLARDKPVVFRTVILLSASYFRLEKKVHV